MTDPKDDDIAAAAWWTKERKEMGIAFAVLLFFGWLMVWYLWDGSASPTTEILGQTTQGQAEPATKAKSAVAMSVVQADDDKSERQDRAGAGTATAVVAEAAVPAVAGGASDVATVPKTEPVAPTQPTPQPTPKQAPQPKPETSAESVAAAERAAKPAVESVAKAEPKPLPPPTRVSDDRDNDGVSNALDQCPDRAGTPENRGCPQSQLSESVQATIRDAASNVSFATGSAVLTNSSKDKLTAVADVLKNNDQYNLVISGHSDSSGNAQNNLALSAERAKACAVHIVAQGIDVNRISATGFGASSPRASNDTPEGRKRNRRVEFQLIERQ